MEESQEILLNSLANSGVPIPPGVSSIQDLTPPTLVSICAHSLRLIDDASSFPTTLPDSMADQFKICTDLASAVKSLGYIGDMSFHKFLYPSEEDMYKLVRFLVGRLSESSEAGNFSKKKNIHASAIIEEENLKSPPKEKNNIEGLHSHNEEVINRLDDLRLKTEVLESSAIKPKDAFIRESNLTPQKVEEIAAANIYREGTQDSSKDELNSVENGKGSIENIEDSRNHGSGNGETLPEGDSKHVSGLEQKLTSPQEHSSKISFEIEKLQSREKLPVGELTAKFSELQHLEEYELLKAAVEMAFDDQHPVDFYITQLNEQIDARRHKLVDLESKWGALRKPLEEKRRSLEFALCATKPEAQEELKKLKEIDLETQSILSETKKRVDELSKLSIDLEKQPKVASRRSYIERINEITKNSRKQDIDIERILKETRELQLESNSIQERLHRTYAVVDETVFREAKKDPVGQQAYRLLTSIHESFEQMSEKILTTDRTRREVADHEAKLAAMASRSLNIDKLQADLDAIRRENELLQQRLQNTSVVNVDIDCMNQFKNSNIGGPL